MTRLWTGLLGVSLALAACGDGTGPGARAEMDVRLAAQPFASGSTIASVLGDGAGALAPISLDAVESIMLTLTAIEALRGTDGAEQRITLSLVEGSVAVLNLLALPVLVGDDDDDESDDVAIRIARGDIPAGTYSGLRLRYDVATATVTLNRDVTVGQHTFTAGTHTLEIPSGAQTGVKVPFQSIVVGDGDDADVVLVFDANATVQNVIATGSGKLLMPPVLHARTSIED
jgi:hypothetical protein